MRVFGKKSRSGMTIMELMVAIGILMLVLGLTISGVMKASEAAKRQRVKAAREALKSAVTAFRQENGYWPGLSEKGTTVKYSEINAGTTYGSSFKGVGFGNPKTGVLRDNAEVLAALEGSKRQFIDKSVIMTFGRERKSCEVTTWRAMREGYKGVKAYDGELSMVEGPGSLDEKNSKLIYFRYFTIIYNLDNDSVDVLLNDEMYNSNRMSKRKINDTTFENKPDNVP